MALIYKEMVIFAVMIKIKIINKGHHPLPEYATPLSAGMDLRANIDEPITLKPMQRMLIPTALYMALPAGYEAQIRPRSGLALKHGITVLNTPGTIDADYRGELKVLLVNFSDTDKVYTLDTTVLGHRERWRENRTDDYRKARKR